MSNSEYNKKLQPNAYKLRNEMTKAEACLWKYVLRAGMMHGYTFRRQRPIGWYIADFTCLNLKLVIEVDGVSHSFEDTIDKDICKEEYLKNEGFTILRFKDEEVLWHIDDVRSAIENMVQYLTENPPPTPASGGHHAER